MRHDDRPTFRVSELADLLADRLVPVGYSRLGYRLRRAHWPTGDPAPGALRGRTAMVTGANSGLGQATVAGLATMGATVVMVVRDETRGAEARAQVMRQLPGAEVVVQRCDVSDLDDVRRFAADSRTRWPVIDVLVHNAGVLPAQRRETVQGHEITLATHVLGPLLLTEGLRPALAASTDARVIMVSSGGMYTQPLPGDDLEYRGDRYRGAVAYARTKRLQVALTPLLARRYAPQGVGVYAMHPGWADTPGVAGSLPGFHRVAQALLRTPTEGADTTCWLAATRPAPRAGSFWHDRRPRPTHYVRCRRDDPARLGRAWRYCLTAVDLDDEENGSET
ncbi:MAG: SDR family NAD(P)-dependent oxidoreductase [Nocardioidaceae bacterium]